MKVIALLSLILAGNSLAEDRSSLAREMLAAHNAARAKVGTPALVWSDRLAAYAQEWARTLLARGEFSHRRNPVYGENLYDVTGGSSMPAEVVRDWVSESRDYSYRNNSCRGTCGHYTQVVWRNTKSVGCAVARSRDREVWVCNYDPPGNFVGEKPY
jgi:uncharacterized protein YkwD